MDRAAVAPLDQHRQPAAMVEVSVGENDRVELIEIHRSHPAIVLVGNFLALVHSHVDHDPGPVGRDDIARPGHFAGGAVESKFDHDWPSVVMGISAPLHTIPTPF